MGHPLAATKRRSLLQVGFDLLQATSLGLRHERADEDERQDSDYGVSQERDARTERRQQARKRLGNDEVGYPVQEYRHSHCGSPDP